MENWKNKPIPLAIHERERVLIKCKSIPREYLEKRWKAINYNPNKNQIGLNL